MKTSAIVLLFSGAIANASACTWEEGAGSLRVYANQGEPAGADDGVQVASPDVFTLVGFRGISDWERGPRIAVAVGQAAYEERLSEFWRDGFNAEQIAINDEPLDLGAQGETGVRQSPLKIPVLGTKYSIVVTAHKKDHGNKCFKNPTPPTPHLGFLISKKGQHPAIVDIHVGAWRSGMDNCAGIYVTVPDEESAGFDGIPAESKQWACWTTCRINEVGGTIAYYLVAYGVAKGAASIISKTVTPIALAPAAVAF